MDCDNKNKGMRHNDASNVIYGMGFIGALIFFIGHASSFWSGAFGIIKAIFWPAMIVYKLLELLIT